MRTRYQYGTLTLRKRKSGPDVWQWRYFEGGRRKAILIGTTERLPNKASALRAIESRRLKLNANHAQMPFRLVKLGALIDRYMPRSSGACGTTHRFPTRLCSTNGFGQSGERCR